MDERTLADFFLGEITGKELASNVEPELLEPIGFAIVASDHFEWKEEDLIGEIFHDWACPQINYELTLENVGRFKRWLLDEEPYPSKGQPQA